MSDVAWTRLRTGLMGLVMLFFIFPMVFMFMMSLKSQPDIASGGFFPEELFWQNYPDAFGSVAVATFLRNSIIAAVSAPKVTSGIEP